MEPGLADVTSWGGQADNFVTRLIQRFHWLPRIGLLAILVVAPGMIWDGWFEVEPLMALAMEH